MRITIMAVLAGLSVALTACGSERSGSVSDDEGNSGEYTIDSETGETEVSIDTPEGAATMRSGGDIPDQLPGGFTVYPGAKVVSNNVVKHAGGEGAMIFFETDASPDEVYEFYKTQAKDAEIEIQMDTTAEDTSVLAGEADDGMVFSLNATRQGGVTSAQIMVSDQM